MFSSPHGDFSFSMLINCRVKFRIHQFSSPHGDFSFSIAGISGGTMGKLVFVPSRGFLFFYFRYDEILTSVELVFVPSRGFLFFYVVLTVDCYCSMLFSSPHGDFSFSMIPRTEKLIFGEIVFVPSRGFLFFYNVLFCQ